MEWVLWYMVVTIDPNGFATERHEPHKYVYPSRRTCLTAMRELVGMQTRDRFFDPIICLPKGRASGPEEDVESR